MSEIGHQQFTLYAVRNSDGKWFRAVGYGGHGPSWVDDIQRARIYPKLGTARGRVGYFANNHKDYPPPDVVEFVVTVGRVVDDTARVEKARKAADRRKAREAEEERMRDHRYATAALAAAKKRIKELERAK